ncbi:MAG: hypothetical protein WC956_02990 [bacterium]
MRLHEIMSSADRDRFFQTQDADRDGRLAAGELEEADRARFSDLDHNKDRFLSPDEIPLGSPAPQVVKLVNLRAVRNPRSPFKVESPSLLATVSVRKMAPGPTASQWAPEFTPNRWHLTIQLESRVKPWRLINVTSATPDVGIAPVAADAQDQQGARGFSLEMATPVLCPVDKLREAVVLAVDFEVAGERRRERIAVDYRCWLGNVTLEGRARAFVPLAQSYMDDPVIKTLVERAKGIPVGSPMEEAARLRQWIGFDGITWPLDPSSRGTGWHGDQAFHKTPSETLWFGGGQCTDYAPMITAWLLRRGLDAQLATGIGHIWTVAKRPSDAQMTVIDFSPAANFWDPLATTPVRSAAPRSGAKPPLPDDIVHFVPDSLLPPIARTIP